MQKFLGLHVAWKALMKPASLLYTYIGIKFDPWGMPIQPIQLEVISESKAIEAY